MFKRSATYTLYTLSVDYLSEKVGVVMNGKKVDLPFRSGVLGHVMEREIHDFDECVFFLNNSKCIHLARGRISDSGPTVLTFDEFAAREKSSLLKQLIAILPDVFELSSYKSVDDY